MADSTDRYIDWKDWRDESFGNCDPLLASYYALETGISAGSSARVLEIGYGNGSFIGWARSTGLEVFGVELNSTLVARARALLGDGRVFQDLHDDGLTRQAGTFSHIVAFDVIEHIRQEDLPGFFARTRSLLAADGRVILRFPNGDSPFGRINQHGDLTHVTTLGSEKLRYFARQAGFAVESIRAPKLALSGVGLKKAFKRRLLLAGRNLVERAVGFLYFGGRRVPMDPNYVAVLVRAQNRR
jgi:2-polyprenyl-3-methyl-5-hydroxy-6-metoxy-1,4-benzoquinol methylase